MDCLYALSAVSSLVMPLYAKQLAYIFELKTFSQRVSKKVAILCKLNATPLVAFKKYAAKTADNVRTNKSAYDPS